MFKVLLTLLLIIATPLAMAYEGKERIVWAQKPINITLNVGEERIIHFPNPVEHWKPDAVKQIVVSQTVADAFYVRATDEFPYTRFRIRDIASNEIYLFDIEAVIDAQVPDELVVINERQLHGESKKQAETIARMEEDWRIRLTRFSSQQLYAPARISAEDYSISRTPLNSDLNIQLVRGGKVKAETVASWQGGGWYVHAVKLINTSDDVVELDPRKDFRGDWSTTTLQHAWLSPKGTDESITAVYFTSRRTFSESFRFRGLTDDQKK